MRSICMAEALGVASEYEFQGQNEQFCASSEL